MRLVAEVDVASVRPVQVLEKGDVSQRGREMKQAVALVIVLGDADGLRERYGSVVTEEKATSSERVRGVAGEDAALYPYP